MNSNNQEIVNVSKNNELFFETNQQAFTELLTFVDFVDSKLNIGFVEINFAQDRDILIETLIQHQNCQDIQFEVLNFPDPDLRFLRDELVEKLKQIKIATDKKLILLITGLEKSIGVIEEYPDVLVNLNFVRDDLRITVPCPLVLFLPDYALTRLAKYAPDFWAWGRKVFYFKTIRSTVMTTIKNVFLFKKNVNKLELQEKKERIDLLLRLLSEYHSYNPQESKKDLSNKVNIYIQIGDTYNSLGEYKQSIDYYHKSLKNAQKINNKTEIFISLMGLSLASIGLKKYQQAIQYHQQLLDIFQKLEDNFLIAKSLEILGSNYKVMGDYQQAIKYYQQSLELFQKLGDLNNIASACGHLGSAYQSLGDYQQAIKYYQQSLELFQELGDLNNIASACGHLGIAYQSLGDYQQAIKYYQQSLELFQELGDLNNIASACGHLGIAYQSLGDYQQAIKYYRQSLELFQELGDHNAQAFSLMILGNVSYLQEEYSKAADYYQKSLESFESIRNRNGEAINWFNLGNIWGKLQQKTKAKTAYKNAKKLYQAMDLDQEIEKCDRAIEDLEN